MITLKKTSTMLALGALALASMPSAQAVATLTLDDGPGGLAPLTVTDNGAGDDFLFYSWSHLVLGGFGAFYFNITSGSLIR